MKVDDEIDTIVTRAYADTKNLLEAYRDKLEALKDLLIDEEIVDGEKVYELLGVADCSELECLVSFD